MADTRTFRNYAESLPIGGSQYLVGANDRRVPGASQGVPAGGTTGQFLGKLSDSDYDAYWVDLPSVGTVTSVAIAAPADFTVSGSPVTTTGTLTLTRAAGYEAYTSTEKAKLSGISTGADVTGAAINAATDKPTPGDTDKFGLWDGALKSGTWANLKATVRTYLLGIASQWTAPQMGSITTLSVASGLIAWDLASSNDFEVTLTANAVWQFPSNASTHVGQKGRMLIKQDGTGGRTFGVASGIKVLGSASLPAILTAASAESYASYDVLASGEIAISLSGVGG